MQKEDNRTPYLLQTEDEIISGNEIYTVDHVLSTAGGTSVLYACHEWNSKTDFVIKECFPMSGYKREGCNIVPLHDDQHSQITLDKYNELLEKEVELSQNLNNHCPNVFKIDKTLTVTRFKISNQLYRNYNGTLNLMVDLSHKGDFLTNIIQKCKDANVYNFTMIQVIITKILDAVNAIHKLNYLHLDIQPGNIYFLYTDYGNLLDDLGKSLACLIDYTTMKKLDENTHRADCDIVFETHDYASDKTGRDYLEYKDDIYSIGVLFYYLLTGDSHLSNLVSNGKTAIDKDELAELGFNTKYANNLKRILDQALDINSGHCYHTCQEMLNDLEAIYDDYMCINGRDDEEKWLINRTEPLVIYGAPGMGKTSFAKHYLIQHPKQISYVDSQSAWVDKIREIQIGKFIIYDTNRELENDEIKEIVNEYRNVIILCDNSQIENLDDLESRSLPLLSIVDDHLSQKLRYNTMAMCIAKSLKNTKKIRNYSQLLEIMNCISDSENELVYNNQMFGKLFELCNYSDHQKFLLLQQLNQIYPFQNGRALISNDNDEADLKLFERNKWLIINSKKEISIHKNTMKVINYLLSTKQYLLETTLQEHSTELLAIGLTLQSRMENVKECYQDEINAFVQNIKNIMPETWKPLFKDDRPNTQRGMHDSEQTDQDLINDLVGELYYSDNVDSNTLCILGDYYMSIEDYQTAQELYQMADDKGSDYAKEKLDQMGNE